jgi:hypothetical protein
LSASSEIGHVRLNNRVRIIIEQLRRPQLRVKVIALGLELGRQAAIEHQRPDLQRLGESGDHEPTLSVRKLG